MKNEFGLEKREEEWYKEYLETWVQINPVGNKPSYFGRLESVVEGYAILRPHLSSVNHSKKGPVQGITRKSAKIEIMGADILPKSERSIRAFAKFNNSKKSDNDSKS